MAEALSLAIIGLNYAPEEIGIGRYTTDMAQALARQGHHVRVVAGMPYYPTWDVDPAWRGSGWRRTTENGVKITRCPHFVPVRPTGFKRILHLASFALSALGPALALALCRPKHRPQVIICIVPAMLCIPVAWLVARLARAKLWVHVQDFEVEAAFATGLIDSKRGMLGLALALEGHLFRLADITSTISPQMCAKLITKGVPPDRVLEIRNWADSGTRFTAPQDSVLRARWGLGDRKVCLYSGNIANKQGVEILIEVARLLAGRRDIAFVVCGQGPNREQLEARASGLGNIQFHDLQPMAMMGDLLGLASVHVLPQIPGAADLVLPSKLTNMLASGRPVVATAKAGTGLFDEVAGCGICVEPGDAGAMAEAIAYVIDHPQEAARFGKEAQARAREHWSRQGVIAKLEHNLQLLAAIAGALAR